MSPKDTAYIVERLAFRFMSMVADHSRQLAEHRAAFGARTEADRRIIEGLRRDLHMLTGLNDKLIADRDEAWKERDALRAEVTDLRGTFDMVNASLGIKPGDHIGRAVEALKKLSPKYKIGDKLESYNRSLGLAIPVTVVGVRTVYDCQGDGAEYPVGHSESELKVRYASHDTPAGKEAAEAVVRDSRSGESPMCVPQ